MTVATPALHTMRQYAVSDEVDVLRRAAGLPHECAACRLDYVEQNITCREHALRGDQWACCDDCGKLITKYSSAARNGRDTWAHVVQRGGVGYSNLRDECSAPVSPLTDTERGLLGHWSKTLPLEDIDEMRAFILEHDLETRRSFRFLLTLTRKVSAVTWRRVRRG